MKPIQPQTKQIIVDALEFLKGPAIDGANIRGLARGLGINPATAAKLVRYLEPFLEIEKVGFAGMKTTLFRLKADKININLSDVLNYLEVKKQIRGKNYAKDL